MILSLGVALWDLHRRKTPSQRRRIHWRGMVRRPAHIVEGVSNGGFSQGCGSGNEKKRGKSKRDFRGENG